MSKTTRLVAALVVGLALLTAAAWGLVHRTTRGWFEKDVRLRSALALSGARRSLVLHWNNPGELTEVLAEITRDERIMTAAACSDSNEVVARTRDFPPAFPCRMLGQQLHQPNPGPVPVPAPGALPHPRWESGAAVGGERRWGAGSCRIRPSR